MAESLQSRKLAEAKKRVERRSAQRAAQEKAEARRAEDQRLENERIRVDHMKNDSNSGVRSRTDEAIAELNKLLKEENALERARKMAEDSAEELRQKSREAREKAAERRRIIREEREKAIVLESQKTAELQKDEMEILDVATDEEKLRRIRMQQTQAIPSLAAILEGVEDLTDEQKEALEAATHQMSEEPEMPLKRNSLYDSDEARLRRIRMQETRTLPSWDDIMGDMEDFDEDNNEGEKNLPEEIKVENLANIIPDEEAAFTKKSQDVPVTDEAPADEMQADESPDKEASDKEASDKEASDKEASDKEASDKEASDKDASDKEASDKEALEEEKSADRKDPSESLLEDLAATVAELDSVGGILASLDTAPVVTEGIPYEDNSATSQKMVSEEENQPPKREWRERQKKSRKNARLICGTVVVGLIAIYAVGANYFRTHFYPKTMMGDSTIACMSEESLRAFYAEKVENYQLQIRQKDGTIDEMRGSDINMKEEWDENIFRNLQEQRGLAWPIKLIQGDMLPNAVTVRYDEKKFLNILNRLDCMSEEKQVMPADARLSNYTVENGYQVLPPMEGTAIDKQLVTSAAENAVKTFGESLDLQEMNAYYTMEYVADMEQLKEKAAVLNDHSHAVINYEIGEEKITLDANTYVEWFDIDENMQVTLNEDKVKEYVAAFAEKYDTYGKPKTFKTSYDTTITIDKNVEYGWEIDQEAECEAIKAEIESGETVTRDLHYNHKAASHTGNDYGNSYVEVSLTDQALFLYKDGSLLLECQVVTGCTNKGNGTPPGIYRIRYKQQDRVLKGEDYETPVHFWMPFNGNIGLHDAYWRGSFGGEIYQKHGSHGCVNMPSKSAEAAYGLVEKGWPVILYEK